MLVKNITAILLLGISSFSNADTDAERTALAKIIHELDAPKALILKVIGRVGWRNYLSAPCCRKKVIYHRVSF